MVLLGHASYSIYILQAPLFIYFADLAGDRSQDLGLVAVYVVVLCAASIVGLVLVERPSQRWLRRVLDRPRPESPSPKRSGAG
jgi:peptidoglycan/LPS O-acetylase OafA/YrhL